VLGPVLYDVSARDPIVYLFALLLMAFMSSLAFFVPARRALKVDPLIALRSE